MNVAGTSEDTGTVALSETDAAERIAALLDPSEDTEERETQEETSEQAEDEEQSEADAEESESEEEGASEAQQPKDDTPVTVKVNGEDVTVTLHELKRGFLREQDYTRKTQELSEQRQAVREERDNYARYIGLLKDKLADEGPLYSEHDLAELRYTDPAEWSARVQENEAWARQKRERIQIIEQEQARIRAQREQEDDQEFAAKASSEAPKLLAAIPEWQDDAKREADQADIIRHLEGLGFTVEDRAAKLIASDHRLIVLARDAMLYRKAATRVPAAVQKAREVALRPGSKAQTPSKVTDVTRAKQRLAKTGRVDDAAAAIERMLG